MSLEQVKAYMEDRHASPLPIEELARLTGRSPNSFGESFKKAFGRSASDYLTELRIGTAKRLLRESGLTMREIAARSGYGDEFYFSRKFKKVVGVPPSVYLKKNKGRVAVLTTSLIGQVLPLGLVPVAAPLHPKWSPYYFNYYQDRIPTHLRSAEHELDEFDVRSLLAAKPDLVLYQEELNDSDVRKLEAAGIEAVRIEADDWRGGLIETARAVGREKQAEEWLGQYERFAAQSRRQLREAIGNATFATLRMSENRLHLYTNRGIRDALYRDLQANPCCGLGGLSNEPIGLEELRGLDPDRILLLVCPDAITRMNWLELSQSAEWKSLSAVKLGQISLILSNPWFEYSAVAIARMVAETLLLQTGKNPTKELESVHGVLGERPL
ncbi:helix-turn-helix domain-containing protein [Cohnella fermenti]|uniref:Helix-turn-helix domain-containing protein n=2 Tax=Cohnella fermenti TaxID=2565925 RepID=A0A4S4C4V7_9BACL|nr:helix-turn-helix domain-containing protein [Cohnella fermenti]